MIAFTLFLREKASLLLAVKRFRLKRMHVVIVPRSTPYDYQKQLKVFLVHSPANENDADINLEEPPIPNRET